MVTFCWVVGKEWVENSSLVPSAADAHPSTLIQMKPDAKLNRDASLRKACRLIILAGHEQSP